MKRLKIISVFICLFVIFAFVGCNTQPVAEVSVFISDNEILTYTPIDTKKTPLAVALSGNVNIGKLNEAFEEKYPDIQVIPVYITLGGVGYKPLHQLLKRGMSPDILFSQTNDIYDIKDELVDISAWDVASRFNAQTLSPMIVDGKLYGLPEPSKITAMLYNKTLFDRYGWTVPCDLVSFIETCKEIMQYNETNGEEEDVEPFNPNLKYLTSLMPFLEGMVYEEVFKGIENRQWLNDLCAGGESVFSGKIEPVFEAFELLIQNGIIKKEHYFYSENTRTMEFKEGKIAMINSALNTDLSGSDYEYGYFPFPSYTNGGDGYVVIDMEAVLQIPKAEREPKVENAIKKYVEFFASIEGQKAYVQDNLMRSNFAGWTDGDTSKFGGVAEALNEGRAFGCINFSGNGILKRETELQQAFRETTYRMLTGKSLDGETTSTSIEDAVIYLDQQLAQAKEYSKLDNLPVQTKKVAYVSHNLTTWETSLLFADVFRNMTGADIALIPHGNKFRGNTNCLFSGTLYKNMLSSIQPLALDGDSALIKVNMTGRQLLDAINNPDYLDGNVLNLVYAFSGLKADLSPWRTDGSKYNSVTLSDGSPIILDHTYTVAFWEGMVSKAYYGEVLKRIEQNGEPVSFENIAVDYFKNHAFITPPESSRYTINW